MRHLHALAFACDQHDQLPSLTEQRLDHFAVVQEMSNIMLTLRQVRVKARFRQ